ISVNGAGNGPASMVAWARTDSSGIIASEGFSQATGNLNGYGVSSGTGWSGNWVAGTGSTVATDDVIPTVAPDPIQSGTTYAGHVPGSAPADAYRLLSSAVLTPG